MLIKTDYIPEFTELWGKLKKRYPEKLFELSGVGDAQLDTIKFTKKFFSEEVADASVDPNSNIRDKSATVYAMESDKPKKRLDSLHELYVEIIKQFGKETADNIIELQISGDIYINDLHGIVSGLPYCFNYTTYDIMTQGLSMVTTPVCSPPKYLLSFKSQLEQFVAIASNSTLGATGLADLLIVMSYYVKNCLMNLKDDNFNFKEKSDVWGYTKSILTSFIYTVNQPYRCGIQSPFTNISIYDREYLKELKDDYVFPDGTTPDIEVVMQLQELFIDIMNNEMDRTPITYPVTSVCISKDDNNNIKDEEFVDMISEKNLKYGFMNIFSGSTSQLSSCCRLRSDKKNEYFNSFGSGSSKIGSLGVCTINLPRLAYRYAKNYNVFTDELKYLTRICSIVNEAKRTIIKQRIKAKCEPLYDLGFMDINKQYSTAGVNGFNECIEILGKDILEKEGVDIGLDIITTINDENDELEKLFNAPHNCEQIPGENVSVKLAQKDELLGFNKDYEMYSNQFIPLINHASMFDRINLQGIYDKHFSGGSIMHLNVENQIEDKEQMKNLIKASIKKGVQYFAINYNIQMCADGHITIGRNTICSMCGKKIEKNFTRVVGFVTCTKDWHKVRNSIDYSNRKFYEGIEV